MSNIYTKNNNEIYTFKKNNINFLLDVKKLDLYKIELEQEKLLHKDLLKLYDKSENEILDYEIKDSKTLDYLENTVSSIAIEVSNDCNLRCQYCYGDSGTYGGNKKMMDKNIAKSCIDFFIKHGNLKRPLSIIFFGGEPLMNYSVIKYIVDYCKEKEKEIGIKFTYGITTNATLLSDDKIDFLLKNNILTTISIDGTKEIHDKNRFDIEGKGSYDYSINKIKKLLSAGVKARARATISSSCLDLYDIEQHLSSLGFEDVVLSFIDINKDSDLYIKKEYFPKIKYEIDKLSEKCIKQLIGHKVITINMFKETLKSLYTHETIKRSCGAGVSYLAFTASGELYPCHRFSNLNNYKIGNMMTERLNNKNFLECSVDNRENCSSCFLRYICGGNCLHSAALVHNSIFKVDNHYCELYRYIIETAMYIYYKVKKFDEKIFQQLLEK